MVASGKRPTGESDLEHQLSETSLLHALLLDGQGGAKSLSVDELNHWSPDQGQLWVHLDYTESATQRWLRESSELNPVHIEALIAENTRPRAFTLDKHSLFAALRGVNLNTNADPEDMVSIRISLDETRMVSCRKRRLQSVWMLIDRLKQGQGPTTLNALFIELNDAMTDRIGEQIIALDSRLESLEDHTLASAAPSVTREELNNLRYAFSRLRRYLGPQRDALAQLQSERMELLSDSEKIEFREISDALIRHIEDLDMMRERAVSAQDDLLSQLSEQLNSRLYLLAIISGIFLPLGFFTGLMGVNLAGMPGADTPIAFWIFTGALTLLSGLLLWLLKRYKWF